VLFLLTNTRMSLRFMETRKEGRVAETREEENMRLLQEHKVL
jgi:hypothetical protein